MKINNLFKVMLVVGLVWLSFVSKNMVCQAAQYEYESNDNYSTANTLTPGNAISGVLNSYEDKDYYKMVVPANGKNYYSVWKFIKVKTKK